MYTDLFNSSKITAAPIITQSFFSGNIIGIAAGSGAAGASASVFTSGVVTGLSNLTSGLIYYAQSDGTLGTTATPYQVGLALSATSLLLKSSDTIANTNIDQFFGDAIFANGFRITEGQGGFQALLFKNQRSDEIARLDEVGTWTISGALTASAGGAFADATTSVPSLLTGAFADAGKSLQGALHAISDSTVRMLGDVVYAANGIFEHIFAKDVNADKLCLGSICINQQQLAAILAANGIASTTADTSGTSTDAIAKTTASVSVATSTTAATDTPPVIQINGDNPAHIHVGDSYSDLGAIITGPQADLNLGLHTLVGSTAMDQAVIDTSAPATYHINYVATDSSDLTSTSTRTVIIEAAPPTSAGQATTTTTATPPSAGGASDAATTTAQ